MLLSILHKLYQIPEKFSLQKADLPWKLILLLITDPLMFCELLRVYWLYEETIQHTTECKHIRAIYL